MFFFFMSFIMNFMMSSILMFFIKKFLSKFSKLLFYMLMNMFKDFIKTNKSILSVDFVLFMMMYNMFMNIINLIPFSFCLNSQIYYFFSLSVVIWMSCLMMNIIINFKKTILHLVPFGCPLPMSFFMVLVELISNFIRPITLSVRMSANLLAGHLLMHLITEFSFYLFNLNMLLMIFSTLMLFILNLLELGVAMIQPYIFSTLINMYMNE